MRLPMRNQSAQMWHTWTPYFNPQPPPAPWAFVAFNCSHPYDGAAAGTKVGSVLATGSYLGASKWILWRLQLADFREKWEAESLSPISLSVSALEAPRRFGHMEKNRQVFQLRGGIRLASHRGYYVIYHRPTIIKTEGGRHVKKEWPWSHICIVFWQHHLDRCLKALRWSSDSKSH